MTTRWSRGVRGEDPFRRFVKTDAVDERNRANQWLQSVDIPSTIHRQRSNNARQRGSNGQRFGKTLQSVRGAGGYVG